MLVGTFLFVYLLHTWVVTLVLLIKLHYLFKEILLWVLKLNSPNIVHVIYTAHFSDYLYWRYLLLIFSQRAWLLKLLAIELNAGDVSGSNHQDACQSILAHLYGSENGGIGTDGILSQSFLQNGMEYSGTRPISKSKVQFTTWIFIVLL